VRLLTSAEALDGLERALAGDAAHVMLAAVDWHRYLAQTSEGARRPLDGLARRSAGSDGVPSRAAARPELLGRLDTLAPARRPAAVLAHVREQAVRVLQLAPNHALDPDRGLKDIGLDSLMAVELRNRLQVSTGRPLPTTLAFDHPTVAAIARYLEQEVLGVGLPAPAEPTPAAANGGLADEINRLSDEEASALLIEELARGREASSDD
jgi:myxalamid-type polyketide synthase MxaE and MxaD